MTAASYPVPPPGIQLDRVLAQVVDLVKRSFDEGGEAGEVSVTLLGAFTDDQARALDEFQGHQGHGPSLAAAASGGTVLIADTGEETRWVAFAREAAAAGVRSCLSAGLPGAGALTIYAAEPHAFDDEAIMAAEAFAWYAWVALADPGSYDATVLLAGELRDAIEDQVVVEQARGILMAERRCTADEAFDLLTRAGQDSGRTVRDVAAGLVAWDSERGA